MTCKNFHLTYFMPECTKGHSPKFYEPKGHNYQDPSSWGWKRKCSDYKEGKPRKINEVE